MAEGPNLVTNGDFPSDISSWGTSISGSQTGSVAWYSPGDSITLIPGWTFIPPMMALPGGAFAYQQITGLSELTDYILTCEVDSSSGTPRGTVGLSSTSTTPISWLASATATVGLKTIPYTTVASETSLYVKMFVVSNGPITPTTRFDDLALKEQNIAGDFITKVIFF